jgi:hypothetical protein
MATPISPVLRHPLAIDRWFGARALARAATSKRDLRLDFFRGLSLLFIFIDHIPNNFLSNVTLHSIAFSDAAEVFVFISGYAAALAYGRVLRNNGLPIATAQICRRVWQLYVAHIFIFAVFAAIVSYSIAAVDDPSYAQSFNISQFLDDPPAAIGQVLILRFQPQFLDILPLYIVLLACFPLVLAAIARHPMYALVPSGMLYALTHVMGWQMPGYPDGATWFFNPLAWQFLFVIGAVVGHSKVSGVPWVPSGRWLFRVAMTFAAVVALVSASWMIQSNFTDTPDFLFTLLAPYVGDKSNLNPVRLASFLALAFATAQLVRPDSSLLATRPAKWLIACGQNSLHIFCFGILLSVLGQFVLANWDDGLAMQALVDLAGGVAMVGLALLLAWDKAAARGPRAREMAAATAPQ